MPSSIENEDSITISNPNLNVPASPIQFSTTPPTGEHVKRPIWYKGEFHMPVSISLNLNLKKIRVASWYYNVLDLPYVTSTTSEKSSVTSTIPMQVHNTKRSLYNHLMRNQCTIVDMNETIDGPCKEIRYYKISSRKKYRSSRAHHIQRPCLDFEKMRKVSNI